ncbi:MAG: family 16 glycoside hydrolase, partial [Bacteroidota bacterium]
MFRICIVLCAAVVLVAGCGSDADRELPTRGQDPFVFRSVLDEKPRMVTVALSDEMWAAYDAKRGSIYKVWKEGVTLDGAVYTYAHGPQPTSNGRAYFVSPYEEPWSITRNGATDQPTVRYKGHQIVDGQASLVYHLRLDEDTVVEVTETPEYLRTDTRHALERTYQVEGLPEDAQLHLKLHLNSLANPTPYETDGELAVTDEERIGAVTKLNGTLTLNGNGTTTLTSYFAPDPMVSPVQRVTEGGDIHPGLALINRSDCQTCHNEQVQTVGPSYAAIAERYAHTPGNITALAGKVISGGAGQWGNVVMTAHPDLSPEDAETMIAYVMSLDGEPLSDDGPPAGHPLAVDPPEAPTGEDQGLVVTVYQFPTGIEGFPAAEDLPDPVYSGVSPALHAPRDNDFQGLENNFYLEAEGYLDVPEDDNYVIRIVSDDGSQVFLDGELLIDNGGFHGPEPKDAELLLEAGQHPLLVKYFQGGGGKALSLQWRAHGDDAFTVIPPSALRFDSDRVVEIDQESRPTQLDYVPGDQGSLVDVHPSFRVENLRPEGFTPPVGGLDVTEDGTIYVSTWDSLGAVYKLTNTNTGNPEAIQVTRIAAGLAEPLGLKVVDGDVYVLQKQELTRLVDTDGDGLTDIYETVSNDWDVSSNFHEFAFGLVYEDGYFYGTLATAIEPGGASTQPQIQDRGRLIKINKDTGEIDFVAQGLRTPNGIGYGVDDHLYIADNQGDWLPVSKIVRVRDEAFYGSYSVDPEGTKDLPVDQPVVWLPQDEIGNSPSQPAPLNVGIYQNQMVHGEVTHGGLKRVFAEDINGQYQGAVFRFTQGLEAGVNRTVVGPDGHLYVGGIGAPGNWGQTGKLWYGLQRLVHTGAPVFEMLAVRAQTNGMEIEFTEPLAPNAGFDPAGYEVSQWKYVPTVDYGGPKVDNRRLSVRSVNISEDRTRVFLELDGMREGHVVYIRLADGFMSEAGRGLWTTEAWYTLNEIPNGRRGFANQSIAEPTVPNTLTEAEQAAGWTLLFDGQSTEGWTNFGTDTIGSAWTVRDGTLMIGGQKDGWQFAGGGDIVTDAVFEDFELSLEWKVATCGNSGIMYLVQETDAFEYPWQTGPEMQILDNDCHPDGKIRSHRAGDLYDLVEGDFDATRPVGEWNQARIKLQDGRLEHWLNGRKLLETEVFTPAWEALIAGSKFNEMP